ncbi:unnamed protein product [Leptidea sinapis]|uniref:Pentraxin (PTX) domain-containing protein n=1 Tax=Leptidea sinapis TaxID=189913 RepID=A0A5E4Q7U4_9NEOP|nr:unnamed protein product [Leptidea sinapis]
MRLIILLTVLTSTWCREQDWQPIVSSDSTVVFSSYNQPSDRQIGSSSQLKILNRRPTHSRPTFQSNKYSNLYYTAPPSEADSCSLYKVSMNQELFYQYLEYDTRIPDLKEFTLCLWAKYHNHTEDHPLFSYAVGDNPKEISLSISNTAEASYFTMAVHGQNFFRLNYPLKLNTWYHSCQSWNGKTGEWQIWVNAERVGRGFNNRLVGHVIKGGGIAVSGQEQSLLYKDDGIEGPVKKQSGLKGEITMLQLYHVALTAGKAHRDHKHHHAHHFKHDGSAIEINTEAITEPPPPEPTPIGNGHFLVSGQLQKPPKINLAQPPQQMVSIQLPNGLQLTQDFINGQLGNRYVSEQLYNGVHQIPSNHISQTPTHLAGLGISQVKSSQLYANTPLGPSKDTSSVILSSSLLNPANVQYIDELKPHKIYKRDLKERRTKRDNPEKELFEERSLGKKDKRGLVALSDGSIVDEALISADLIDDNKEDEIMFQQSLLNGLAGVVGNLPVQNLQKMTGDEREPAEAEVKAVMQVCSGCTPEPFKKVQVLSWRHTPKKLYSGAHYYKGLPICRAF